VDVYVQTKTNKSYIFASSLKSKGSLWTNKKLRQVTPDAPQMTIWIEFRHLTWKVFPPANRKLKILTSCVTGHEVMHQ